MACRVPGCSSRYWDKNNKFSLFKAPSVKQLVDWQEILRRKGVDDFGANDLVCIIHFEEDCIERERIIYKSGGIVSRQPRKVLLLTNSAVPTIFPSKIPCTERKKRQKPQTHLEYAVTIDAEALAKHREVLKRKLPSEDSVSCDDVKSAKQIKTNNLFQKILDTIHDRKKVSPHLNNLWIANVCDDKCIRWSLWKVDRSGEEKGIILHQDLKVEVFVNEKKIQLPYTIDSVVEMCDVQNLFKKISQIIPCKVADYESKELNVCLGFVVKNVGRQRVWCIPCSKYQTNLNRRMATPLVKTLVLKKAKQRLHVRCNKLRRGCEMLKIKVKALKKSVLSLKKQCEQADKTVLDKAIGKLPFSEQAAVKSCFAAAQVKDMRGMRYTTQWVYECLLLRIKSKKAYEHLRRRRILVLPDISTLNRYIKRIGGCYGFQTNVFKVIAEKTRRMKSDEVHGTLLVDEMELTKALSFNRQNLRVEGFTDLGKYTPKHQRGKKGDHALVFMFQPFKGIWVQSLACFLSKGSATGTVLHQLIIECIALVEKSGLRIDAVTTDGATWNRNMWKIFGVTTECVSVPHVVDSKRRLWFLSDFPHLIKCMRNFFTHKGRDENAGIWTPDGIVSLSHWYALPKVEDENAFNLKVNFKLRKEHLNPQFYDKMNVAIAFQFFGLADAMELFRDKHSDLTNCGPSIQFSRRVKSLITAMNCRTPMNNLKPGNDMWKISLRSTLEVCKYLVEKCAFSYLMTSRLNQDSLERFFGMMRNCCGSNDHPDSILFIQRYQLVSTYSLVKPPKGSNICGGEILHVLLSLKDITDADERWEQCTGQIDTIIDRGINCNQLLNAASVLEDHDYFVCTTSDYVLTYVSGFVARKSSRFIANGCKTPCEECVRSLLLDPADEIPESHKLIELKSYGYLKHPSKTLFALISILEHGTLKAIREKDLNAETLFDVTEAIEQLSSIPFVGCSEHAPTRRKKLHWSPFK